MGLNSVPFVADSNATLQARVNGGAYGTITSGAAERGAGTGCRPNTINVLVTAQDGTTTEDLHHHRDACDGIPLPSGQVHGGTAGSYDWPFSSMAKDSAGNIYGFWRRDSGATGDIPHQMEQRHLHVRHIEHLHPGQCRGHGEHDAGVG